MNPITVETTDLRAALQAVIPHAVNAGELDGDGVTATVHRTPRP